MDGTGPGVPHRRTLDSVVPTELLVTAMLGGFAIAMTAIVALTNVLSSRIGDVREEVRDLRGDFGGVRDELVTVRAALGAIEARLSTLEQR